MKKLILFSIIAFFAITVKATGTDSTTTDSSKTIMKTAPFYYGDSAAIVNAGKYLKLSAENFTNSMIFASVGTVLVATAPLTIKTTYDAKTKTTTVDPTISYMMYGVGALCGLASSAFTIQGIKNLGKAGKALKYRASPTGISVQYSF